MSNQTLQLIAAIRERLKRTRLRMTGTSVVAGAVFTTGLVAYLWIAAVLLESVLWMPHLYRGITLAVVLVLAAWSIASKVLAPALR